ncbi:MAG: TonB family protein [Myxococcota bacterium]
MAIKEKFRGNGRFIACCLLAVLLHIPLFFWGGPHAIVPLHSISAPARVSYYTPPKPKTPLPTVPKQVVHLPEPAIAKRPQHAEFVSEWDNTVSKQTRSMQTSTKPTRASSSTGSQKEGHFRQLPQETKGRQVPKSDTKKLLDTLFPSRQQLQQQMHLDFADALPAKIPVDNNTQLNTFSWRHATFFNRVKESVAQAWHPAAQLRRHNPNGLGLKGTRVTTSLWITMNRDGKLVNIVVLQSSGFAYLDETAQAAFWQAQPFLRPPTDLFIGKKHASFQFSFTVHAEGWAP